MFSALIDSRRLMGANLYSNRPGAVLEIAVDPSRADELVARWQEAARFLLDAIGYQHEVVLVRRWPGGLGLFVSAPIDGLMAATEVTEQALAEAEEALHGRWRLGEGALQDTIARIRVYVQHDRNPRLVELAAAAAHRDRVFTFDDEQASVGSGTGARTWPVRGIPQYSEIDWRMVSDIPVALVTGSNGKTTTTRMLAAILRAAGYVTGHTCTDGVFIDGILVEEGDWAGPAGTRRVLRDGRVTAAVLEAARGGILRRGLATTRADVAIVTRIAADHLGEYGVHDERTLGEAKLVVARALRQGAPLVLNAEDPALVALSSGMSAPTAWFALDARAPRLESTRTRGDLAVFPCEGVLCVQRGMQIDHLVPIAEIPATLEGRARHNVANVLAATAAACALGVQPGVIGRALRTFGASPDDNPGRLHVREMDGVTVIVDFVHNPDGWHAVLDVVAQLRRPGSRLLVTLGQAGDRNDADLDAMARVVWEARPDVIVLKEMEEYLRGRPYGQVTERLRHALLEAGAPESLLLMCPDELRASRAALDAARPGDVVVVAAHAHYDEVIRLLDRRLARAETSRTS